MCFDRLAKRGSVFVWNKAPFGLLLHHRGYGIRDGGRGNWRLLHRGILSLSTGYSHSQEEQSNRYRKNSSASFEKEGIQENTQKAKV